MPEPLLPAAATLAAQAALVPALTLFGMRVGLQPDVLLAGFGGSIAAMALLNTVPSTGDTFGELLRTGWRRAGVALGSALFAGYIAPLPLLLFPLPEAATLSIAFLLGAGAQYQLPRWAAWGRLGPPPPPPSPTDQGGPQS